MINLALQTIKFDFFFFAILLLTFCHAFTQFCESLSTLPFTPFFFLNWLKSKCFYSFLCVNNLHLCHMLYYVNDLPFALYVFLYVQFFRVYYHIPCINHLTKCSKHFFPPKGDLFYALRFTVNHFLLFILQHCVNHFLGHYSILCITSHLRPHIFRTSLFPMNFTSYMVLCTIS